MPFRKYRAITEFSKNDTRIFKQIYNNRLKTKAPAFKVPESIKARGIPIVDAIESGFAPSYVSERKKTVQFLKANNTESFLKKTALEDHPLYHQKPCHVFQGAEPFSDGTAQASALSNSVFFDRLPKLWEDNLGKIEVAEEKIRDAILHGEKFDPTLEKLPKRFDPVIFWVHHPRVHGTPVCKKNNIILDNLYRHVLLARIAKGEKAENFRLDRDEYISSTIFSGPFMTSPLVLRFQPHLTIQTVSRPRVWAHGDVLKEITGQPVPSCHPISPIIDLEKDHIYNEDVLIPRKHNQLFLNTVMWTREQDQKYPWTKEQNAANAIMHTFGTAVAQARRNGLPDCTLETPILMKGVQLVDGKLDLVAVQLNTTDLSSENPVKNIVWVEKAARLYRPRPFYESLKHLDDFDIETFKKFAAFIIS